MLIELSALTKSYKIGEDKVQRVLNGISFSMDRGELVALVGESGSGEINPFKHHRRA